MGLTTAILAPSWSCRSGANGDVSPPQTDVFRDRIQRPPQASHLDEPGPDSLPATTPDLAQLWPVTIDHRLPTHRKEHLAKR
jgi:hypothetical protein